MNKALKAALIVLTIGVTGYAIYYFWGKKKAAANGGENLPPPPSTATPPINGALIDPNSGAGSAAIDRRVSELMKSSVKTEVEDSVRSEVNILQGVSDAKRAYYEQNISRDPITSTRKVPFALNALQKSALQTFTTIDTSTGGQGTAGNLLSANLQMMDVLDTCFIGNPELQNVQKFIQEVYCQGYENCGKNYKDMFNDTKLLNGGKKAGADMSKMASAWLAGSGMFDEKIRLRAINDLRAAGWRFTGFDF